MASRFSDLRKKEAPANPGVSRFSSVRQSIGKQEEPTTPVSTSDMVRNARQGSDVVRNARSAQSHLLQKNTEPSKKSTEPSKNSAEAFKERSQPANTLINNFLSNKSVPSLRVDQSKKFNEDFKAQQAERERVSRESTQGAMAARAKAYEGSAAQKMDNDPIARNIGYVDKLGMRAANKLGDFLGISKGIKKSEPKAYEQIPASIRKVIDPILSEPTTRVEKGADIVGEGLGYIAPTEAAYKLLGKTAIKKAGPVLGRLLTGTVAGSGVQGTKEVAEELSGQNNQTVKQRLMDVGLAGALNGVSDAAIPVVGGLIKKLRGTGNNAAADVVESAVRNETPRPQTAETTPNRPAEIPSQPVNEPIQQNWFTRLFGDQGVGITAGSTGRGSGRAVNSEGVIVRKAIREDKGTILDDVNAKARATHQNLVDKLEPLKHGGHNVYETAMDATRSNQIANQIIGKEFVTPEGVVSGEGMESIFKSIPRGKDKTFLDYLIVKDAQARIPRGERVYDESIKVPHPSDRTKLIELNSEEGLASRRAELERQYPWLPQMSERWNAFTGNLRKHYGVNEGLLSEDMSNAMAESRPDYIKMLREFSKSEKPGRAMLGRSSADTFTGLKAPIKRVNPNGSARNIVDPRKTMAESVGAWVNNAMRNRVGQQLVGNILHDPEAFKGIARIVPETAEATQKSLDEINEILQRDGVDGLAEKMNKDYEIAFKKGSQTGGKDNTISVMMDGKPVKVEILNPEMALAFQGMNPSQLGLVMQVAKFGSDFTKRSATGAFAPVFAAKSAVVDLPVALIQAKGNRARFLVDYGHALGSGLANKLGIPRLKELARDYERAGGGYSASMKGERGLNKQVKNLERNPILSGKNLYRQGEKLVKAPFKLTEEFANVFENAPRIAAAKGELRRLGGVKTASNVRKAMQEGREVTVNYSRKGRMTDELEALSPYTNAAIQGVTRMGRQIAKKPLQTFAAMTVIVGLPKTYEYMQFHDDPDYQRLPAREKFRNIIISKNADGTFNKIPLEPSYAAVGAAAVDFLQYIKDKDPNVLKGMSDALANAYLPPLASGTLQGLTQGGEGDKSAIEKSGWGLANATSFGPAMGTLANQSFTGAPIDSAAVADRSHKYRYDEKTSTLAKKIGEKLNFSPMKTDYVLKQYGGDIARLGLPLTSQVGSGTQKQTLLRNFIVDPVFTNNLTNDFYAGKTLINQAYKDSQEVDAPLPKWFDDSLRKYISSTAKGSISKQLSDYSKEKKSVQSNSGLTAKEKASRIRGIQQKINNIYIDVNSRLQKAGVPLPRR